MQGERGFLSPLTPLNPLVTDKSLGDTGPGRKGHGGVALKVEVLHKVTAPAREHRGPGTGTSQGGMRTGRVPGRRFAGRDY